ncbi:MAG: alkaline phosphatase D family protein [Gordonia sp. (in: high G+C Gram-positive bacteria)]|uniref:alkaline phosphatase D family protein n=1 Tax=Gordonia sp. (in: high G+C Gram-positive bacteria) TaxID=84139 RepID=UPI0039E55C05
MNIDSPSAISRRTFAVGAAGIAGAGVLGASLAAAGRATADGTAPARTVFAHGVASGDPLPDAIILWTRVTPTADAKPGSGRGPAVTVDWEMSRSADFSSIVASGSAGTDASRDHTVKVDVSGLAPATQYWYRFRACGATSPVGRTKTAPPADTDPSKIRFGVVSCSNWEAGYFVSYRKLAERKNLDAVVHLGDYIYEYGAGEYGGHDGSVRTHDPRHDIVSLADYRIRHAQYKTDADLQAAHRTHPFICTWDDHESADNSWSGGAENHDPRTQGPWAPRKAHADQAYYEWMPVRPQVDENGRHLYRRFRYGTLLELNMLDLRTYRTEQPSMTSTESESSTATITGARQMNWVTNSIETSTTRWQIIGNSVMITPVVIPPLDPARTRALTDLLGVPAHGVPFNTDSWDGYQADRQKLLTAIDKSGKRNTVFITGDIHMSWACEVPRNVGTYPGSGSVATELVCTSITSNNLDDMVPVPENTLDAPASVVIPASNPQARWVDTDHHGYSVLTVTPSATQMDWFYVVNRADPRSGTFYGKSWKTVSGTARLTPVSRPAS